MKAACCITIWSRLSRSIPKWRAVLVLNRIARAQRREAQCRLHAWSHYSLQLLQACCRADQRGREGGTLVIKHYTQHQ